MNTKLTLRMDEHLIELAKQHSERTGKSVSRIVADYFALISADDPLDGIALSPRVRSLIGSLRGAVTTEVDHREHLVEKHR